MTVSTGPSSRSFPHVDKLDEITIMNSAEEISKYSDNNSHYRSPTLARRAGTELEERQAKEKTKKDKKWSLGGFFRRRKKEVESETTSEEENPPKRGFLQRRKQRKEDKRKKRTNKSSLGHFDHIVVTPLHQTNNYVVNGNRDDEIFSEPTLGIPSYNSGSTTRIISSNERITSKESLKRQDLNHSRGSLGSVSQDSSGKKSRREKAKARAEALRDKLKKESSSDEESQRSTTSSITRFKSDDSLSRKDGTTTRKSRSARTERYNRRLTKEEELVLNKEAEIEKQKDTSQTRVQVNRWVVVDEMPKSPPIKPYIKPTLNYSPSVPLPQKTYSGISTIPPSHSMIHRTTSNLSDGPRNYFNSSHKPANIYNNAIRHPADPMRSIPRHYANSYHERPEFKPEQRSFSYDCNINRTPSLASEEQVLHVHFPLGKPIPKQRNPNLINQNIKTNPPPPPPRDPQRRIFTNSQYENARPMSYAFENGNHSRPVPVHQIDRNSRSFMPPAANINRAHSFGWQPNYRSNSEDHIAQVNHYNPPVITRPASATPDAPQQRYIRRHPTSDQYKYFAEKTPRSRKPIHIAATPMPDQMYLSDSQVVTRSYSNPRHPVHLASEFWKQKDAEEINRRKSQIIEQKDKPQKSVVSKKPEEKEAKKNFAVLSIPVKTTDSLSSLSNSGNSDASPPISKPFFEPPETSIRPLSIVSEKSEVQEDQNKKKEPPEPPVRRYSRQSSASSTENNWNDPEEQEKKKRRSTNLEDALDELEAIYKSLRLGDEDLLDRAERRDVPVAAQKLLTKMPETYVNWGTGTQSDSGFNYDFDFVDGLRKKRNPRRSNIPDKLNDDMAYRRLNKDRPPPLDPSVAVSQVSYLLASPVLGGPVVDENDNESTKSSNEPDITLDDVVYRNIKHTNNSLKTAEPQPFGIPIGPITAAANSDYLHAVPENLIRSRFIPRKSPDIVKDDLAYRSLRKDSPGLGPDDYINNNNTKVDLKDLKKRKAVRSISANIYNMMHRDTLRASESENEFDKAQSLTDIADAMEIARQILKDRQNKIYRKSASSDTEAKPVKSNNATSTETLTESQSNLLNDIKVSISGNEESIKHQKPPICPTPKTSKPPTKDSTPNCVSPALEQEKLDNNHLSDLLTALAIETQETSEKLGNDLKLLDEEVSRKASPRISQPSTPSGTKSPIVSKSLDEKLSDIDAVSEHAKLCEKLLGAVVESTKLLSHSNDAELEEVSDISEPKIYKSIANVVVTRKAEIPTSDPRSEQCSESEHDYENIHKSDNEEVDEDAITCTSPFEENKSKLLADFEELKRDLFSDELLDNDEIKDLECNRLSPEDDIISNKLQDSCSEGGEICSAVCLASTEFEPNEIFTPPEAFITSNEFEYNLQNYLPLLSKPRTRDDSEHSSGFHTESRGSSVDSSLSPVMDFSQNLPEVETTIMTDEICGILHQVVDHVFDARSRNNFFNNSFGSTDETDTLDKSDNKPLLDNEPNFVSRSENYNFMKHFNLESTPILLPDNCAASSTNFNEIKSNSKEDIKYGPTDRSTSNNVDLPNNVSSESVDELDGIFTLINELVEHDSNSDDAEQLTSSEENQNSSANNQKLSSEVDGLITKFSPSTSELHFEENALKSFSSSNSNIIIDQNDDQQFISTEISNICSQQADLTLQELNINKNLNSCNLNSDESSLKSPCRNNNIPNSPNLVQVDDQVLLKTLLTFDNSNTSTSTPDIEDPKEDSNEPFSKSPFLKVLLPKSLLPKPLPNSSSPSSSSQAMHDTPSTSSNLPSNSSISARTHPQCEEEPEERLDSHPGPWYQDPATLALACSYTLAFMHQLAIVDIVTLLGIFLAIVTVVAAFVL